MRALASATTTAWGGKRARKPLGFEDERAEGRESVHRQLDLRPCELGRELDLGRRQGEPRR
jgi:hypothetical protein